MDISGKEKEFITGPQSSERLPTGSMTVARRNGIIARYKEYTRGRRLFIICTVLFLFMFTIFALSFGSADIPFTDIIAAFLGKADTRTAVIIFKIRLPRIMAAIFVGMALSVAGAVIQTILGNPLGSPYTLGISPAASFGAAFAVIILGAGSLHSANTDAVVIMNPYTVTTCAFLWCLLSTFMLLLAVKSKGAKPEIIILMGIMIGSLFNAGTAALEYFAQDVQLASIIYWTFGNLSRGNITEVLIIGIISITSTVFFVLKSAELNALQGGDEVAGSLGVNTERLRIVSMIIASLSVSTAVAFYGIIAFVGLVVPHMVRRAMKTSDNGFVIPGCAVFGGLFLLAADTIARLIVRPLILPVGVLTSFLGVPLFLYLLIRKR